MYAIQLSANATWNYGGTGYDRSFYSGSDQCYAVYNDAKRTYSFTQGEMKALMQSGEYTKKVYGCAYIRKDWKNHKNHLKGKQHEWWWDRQVNAVAKVVNTETYFIEGVTKPKTNPRSMVFTLYGYNHCGTPAWSQGFSFVLVGDPYPIYDANEESE